MGSSRSTAAPPVEPARTALGARILNGLPAAERRAVVAQVLHGRERLSAHAPRIWVDSLARVTKVDGYRQGRIPAGKLVAPITQGLARNVLYCEKFLDAWCELNAALLERTRELSLPASPADVPPAAWPWVEGEAAVEQLGPFAGEAERNAARLAVLLCVLGFDEAPVDEGVEDEALNDEEPWDGNEESYEGAEDSSGDEEWGDEALEDEESQDGPLDPVWVEMLERLAALPPMHTAWEQVDQFAAAAYAQHERALDELIRAQNAAQAAREEEKAREARAAVEASLRQLLEDFEPELAYLELDCAAWTAVELPLEDCIECPPLLERLRELLTEYRALRAELLNARTKAARTQLEPKENACEEATRGLFATLSSVFTARLPLAGAQPEPSPPTAPAEAARAATPAQHDTPAPAASPAVAEPPVEAQAALPARPAPAVPEPAAPAATVAPPSAVPTAPAAAAPEVSAPEAPKGLPAPSPTAPAASPKPEKAKAVASEAEKPATSVAPRLSAHLTSWEAFSTAYWVGAGGQLEKSPWQGTDFAQRLRLAATEELSAGEPRFWRLRLLSAAAASVPGAELPSPAEVQALGELWSLQTVPAGVRSAARGKGLLTANEGGNLTPSLASRALLFLEAAAPSLEAPLARGEAATLAGAGGWRSKDLESVVAAMLDFAGYGENPIERFRALPQVNGRTDGDLRLELTARRQQFHEFVSRHWKSCGGKAPRPHCRHAWSEFIDECAPLLKKLYPPEHHGLKQWGRGELTADISRIEEVHRKHADRRGANWEDRASMDRVAARIAREAADIDALMLRLARKPASTPDVHPRGGKLPLESLRRLLDGDQLSGDEEFYRRLLVRLLRARPSLDAPDLFHIPLTALCRTPELLLTVPHVRVDAGTPVLTALDVQDVRLAAALLLQEASTDPDDVPANLEALIESLNTPERQHLLARLVPTLPTALRERVHAQSAQTSDALHARIADLQASVTALSELASPMAPMLGSICREAEKLVTPDATADGVPPSPVLLGAWLGEVRAEARATQDALVAGLREDAQGRTGEEGEAALQAIQSGQFALALGILRGAHIHQPTGRRATLWRQEARARFSNPARLLREPLLQPSVPKWTDGISSVNNDRAVRTEFAKLFLNELYEASPKAQHEISIACADIRQEVVKRGLNPSYLPQLNYFGALVIPGINLNPSATNFVPVAAATAARSNGNLVLLLAPGITERVRQSLIEELIKRKVTAAVVDDLDMCRLLNPDQRPDPLLGILEILLEQQRWSAVTPFRRHEGQHQQLEMYVGRTQEARDLAVASEYSRLFSGRKMGKSALLRFVESHYDGREMPDRTQLRVVYVSAVGIEQSSAMADRIIGAVAERLGARELVRAHAGLPAGERLDNTIRQYLAQNENVSLLLVLDEADTFVEQELEEYEAHREACLSFLMRSKLMEMRSAQGMPRVRFVFTGYRVTNTSEGAWGNWGKVLKLTPLQADDAAGLVAGPLARLGVDAMDQAAAIAHRCGYQPAVILSFCERLLTKLEERWTPVMRLRTKPTVTAQDVAATFEDSLVQEEIRTVAKNNFHGNGAGKVVFLAILNEFLSLSATQGLTHAETRLRERLEGLCEGDWSWLRPESETVEGELSRHLRDMEDRQLLSTRRNGAGPLEYLLKFPHHLTVLAPLAQEEAMRAEIRNLQKARTESRGTRAAQGLLSRHRLKCVRDVLDAQPAVGVPVVGVLWPTALSTAQSREGAVLARGLFDRLGLDTVARVDARNARALKEGRLQARVAFLNVTPADVPKLLAERGPASPPPLLVGGADLLRATLNQSTPLPSRPGEEVAYEAYGVGRLSRAALAWWFERARGVNFTNADAIALIHQHTSGIPLLVAELDRMLLEKDPEGGGLEVGQALLSASLEELGRTLPRLAKHLRKGPGAMRLEPRELALLEMFSVLAEASTQKDVYADLTEYWPIICESNKPEWLTHSGYQGLGDGDAQRLGLLQQLGLLPTRPDVETVDAVASLAPVRPDDALLRLARALHQEE